EAFINDDALVVPGALACVLTNAQGQADSDAKALASAQRTDQQWRVADILRVGDQIEGFDRAFASRLVLCGLRPPQCHPEGTARDTIQCPVGIVYDTHLRPLQQVPLQVVAPQQPGQNAVQVRLAIRVLAVSCELRPLVATHLQLLALSLRGPMYSARLCEALF